jgi:hypothetical protein
MRSWGYSLKRNVTLVMLSLPKHCRRVINEMTNTNCFYQDPVYESGRDFLFLLFLSQGYKKAKQIHLNPVFWPNCFVHKLLIAIRRQNSITITKNFLSRLLPLNFTGL